MAVSTPDPDPLARDDVLDTTAAGPMAARGGALRAAGYGFGTLLSVVAAPLMIRHLGIADYGRYVAVLSLVTIVVGLTDAGLGAIALREYSARRGSDRDGVMRDLLGVRILLALASAVAAVLFAVVAGYPSVQIVGTAAIGVAFVMGSVQTVLLVSLQAELRYGWVTTVEVLRQGLLAAIVVVLVLADGGLDAFCFALIPAFGVTLVLTAVLVRGLQPLRPAFHLRRCWPLLRDTLTFAVAVAVNAAYFRVAIIALSLLASEHETGYFATAFRVMEVLIGVPSLIIGAAFPILARAARDDDARLDSTATRLVEVALVLGVWLALMVALAAEPIIDVLAGAGGRPAIVLLRILGVALIASFVTVACAFVLLSLRCHRAILLVNLTALAVSLALTLALVPSHGARGAAVAVLVAEVVLVVSIVSALVRERPAVAVAVRRAPAILAAGGVASLVVLVPDLPPLADTAVAAVAFPLLLLAVRRFPPEIADALRHRTGVAVS